LFDVVVPTKISDLTFRYDVQGGCVPTLMCSHWSTP
jgi:hypothetical protein